MKRYTSSKGSWLSLMFAVLFLFSNIVQASDTCYQSPSMDFFNSLSGKLIIEASPPPEQMENLKGVNLSNIDIEIENIELESYIYVEESSDFRGLTDEELSLVAYSGSEISLISIGGIVVTHQAENNKNFTVKNLLSAVEKTELETRVHSEWFGGMDIHHVYFEGMECDSGIWEVVWGS